ncbi:alpha/beta fold hydrolase [Kitasatospora sp. NPDC051170]|uniref:alpha/beta fold hydrolase n=1 Tax=Kitasatospora sp. NPDC051170 TaxID=3364056 RepID=UPI0037AC6E16
MPEILRPDGARIHYQVHGEGFPVLLLAPGGVSSEASSWDTHPYHPVRELAPHFQVIVMDQRHAGASHAPALPFDYAQTSADQLAVLDELGIEQAHLVAAGSGCVHAWRLAHDAPERVRSVVAERPVGRDASNTLGTYFRPFDEAMRHPRAEGVAGVLAAAEENGRFADNPAAGPFAQRLHDDEEFRAEIGAVRRENYITLLVRFRDGLWPDGSAYFSVPEAWMAEFPAPLLVLPGDDAEHPEGLAKRIVHEAPQAVLPEASDSGTAEPETASILAFLRQHTPR